MFKCMKGLGMFNAWKGSNFQTFLKLGTFGHGVLYLGKYDSAIAWYNQSLLNGKMAPDLTYEYIAEINKGSGDLLYVDNRAKISRNLRQKEDIKIILEF